MSQEQPRRAKLNQAEAYARAKGEPIKYGDVFNVEGELAREPIAPRDASMMQSAEKLVVGHTWKGGPAAIMQSAATRNERAGLVGHRDVSGLPANQGVSVTETNLLGSHVVTESVGGQVVERYETPVEAQQGDTITMLETTVMTEGESRWNRAISMQRRYRQRKRGRHQNEVLPVGVAAEVQSAANANQSE